MPRVSQVSHYGRPEYSAVRCLLFGANLTDVGILRYVCLLFPDGKNILASEFCCFDVLFCIREGKPSNTVSFLSYHISSVCENDAGDSIAHVSGQSANAALIFGKIVLLVV